MPSDPRSADPHPSDPRPSDPHASHPCPSHTRRRLIAAGGACALAAPALAQSPPWPAARPIRFVVPFSAGGANDLMGRAAAEGASKVLGQNIVVENRPGAGSTIGADHVAKSAPDGYTFLVSAAGTVSNPLIKKSMPYPDGALVPVAFIALAPSIIIVRADAPWTNLKAFIEASRSGKGFLFATAGTGSTPHFVASILNNYGARLQAVPYKSGGESTTAIASGQVEATSEASIVSLGYLKAGRFRGLANTWTRRLSAYPDLPTATEQGYPDLQIAHWAGLHAPRGTPPEILDRVAAAIDAAMKNTAVTDKLRNVGIEPQGGTRAGFEEFVARERSRLSAVVRSAGMTED